MAKHPWDIALIHFFASTGARPAAIFDPVLRMKHLVYMPNPANIKDPAKSQLVRELIEQLKHEEMLLTPSSRESFDHPTGRHNDLGIAWKLSIHGCIRMGLKIDMPGNRVIGQVPEMIIHSSMTSTGLGFN